jgi:hypothetical protein
MGSIHSSSFTSQIRSLTFFYEPFPYLLLVFDLSQQAKVKETKIIPPHHQLAALTRIRPWLSTLAYSGVGAGSADISYWTSFLDPLAPDPLRPSARLVFFQPIAHSTTATDQRKIRLYRTTAGDLFRIARARLNVQSLTQEGAHVLGESAKMLLSMDLEAARKQWGVLERMILETRKKVQESGWGAVDDVRERCCRCGQGMVGDGVRTMAQVNGLDHTRPARLAKGLESSPHEECPVRIGPERVVCAEDGKRLGTRARRDESEVQSPNPDRDFRVRYCRPLCLTFPSQRSRQRSILLLRQLRPQPCIDCVRRSLFSSPSRPFSSPQEIQDRGGRPRLRRLRFSCSSSIPQAPLTLLLIKLTTLSVVVQSLRLHRCG